jgi:hypothetical protein
MPKPHVQEFEFDGEKLTSVVVDREDFEAFCDELEGVVNLETGERANKNAIDALRKSGHLPLMGRGIKTEKFFKQWGVKTDKMAVVVRGTYSRDPERTRDLLNGLGLNGSHPFSPESN